MVIKTRQVDGGGSGLEAEVRTKRDDTGLVTLTEPLHDTFTTVIPLLNATFGADMNQNIAFTDTPELIHDGGDNVGWTGAAVAGTWDFADTTNPNNGTKCVSITAADNNSLATFLDATETAMSGRTAVTGKIRLETFNETNNTIILQFQNNNVDVGNSVDLVDFLNAGILNAYQSFVIPKSIFGIDVETVDEIDMTVTRTGGAKPTFRFDQFQIEETGTPAIFIFQPTEDQVLKLIAIKIVMADGVTAASSFNAFFGVSVLANGIGVIARSTGQIVFAGTFTRLFDFLSTANSTFEDSIGAADSWMSINIPFNDNPVILNGKDLDFVAFTIIDNLSGLSAFRVFVTVTEDI